MHLAKRLQLIKPSPTLMVTVQVAAVHDAAGRPGLAKRMDELVFGHMLTPQDVAVLQQYIDDYPGAFDKYALYDCLSLGASLPGFQWS
jgi:hypothetical protein